MITQKQADGLCEALLNVLDIEGRESVNNLRKQLKSTAEPPGSQVWHYLDSGLALRAHIDE